MMKEMLTGKTFRDVAKVMCGVIPAGVAGIAATKVGVMSPDAIAAAANQTEVGRPFMDTVATMSATGAAHVAQTVPVDPVVGAMVLTGLAAGACLVYRHLKQGPQP
jgi:hypothetical protein